MVLPINDINLVCVKIYLFKIRKNCKILIYRFSCQFKASLSKYPQLRALCVDMWCFLSIELFFENLLEKKS